MDFPAICPDCKVQFVHVLPDNVGKRYPKVSHLNQRCEPCNKVHLAYITIIRDTVDKCEDDEALRYMALGSMMKLKKKGSKDFEFTLKLIKKLECMDKDRIKTP